MDLTPLPISSHGLAEKKKKKKKIPIGCDRWDGTSCFSFHGPLVRHFLGMYYLSIVQRPNGHGLI